MTKQNPLFSQQVREFFSSELFALMLNIAAASGSPCDESYCTISLARKARIHRSHARKIIRAELHRRQSSLYISPQEACAPLGGAA